MYVLIILLFHVKLSFDPLTDPKSTSMTIGGVMVLELATLPAPAHKVGNWTIRQFNQNTSSKTVNNEVVNGWPTYPGMPGDIENGLTRLSYPPVQSDLSEEPVGGFSNWSSLRIAYPIPPNVFIRAEADPKISRFNPKTNGIYYD